MSAEDRLVRRIVTTLVSASLVAAIVILAVGLST